MRTVKKASARGGIIFLALLIVSLSISLYFSEKEVVIYIDDIGGHPQQLRQLSEILPQDANTTYFIIPVRLTEGDAVLLEGKQIGLHGYEHYPSEFVTSSEDAKAKIKAGKEALGKYNLTATYFRPPSGLISHDAKAAVESENLVLVEPLPDYLFGNPCPTLTVKLLKAKLLLTKKLRMSLHLPMDEKTLNSLRLLK